MNKNNYYKWLNNALVIVGIVSLFFLWVGCNEDEKNSIHDDPYAGGREPLVVKLLNEKPDPEIAGPKEEVTFQASGLAKYCNPEEGRYEFEFYISDERCEIVTATDSTVTIIVPDALSSGASYLVLNNQIFYGPYFKVSGSVSLDEGFTYYKTGPYAGIIYSCLPWVQNTALTSEFYFFGDFRQASNKFYGGLAMINNVTGLIKYGTSGKLAAKYGISTISTYDPSTGTSISNELRGATYWQKDTSSPRALIYGTFKDYEELSNTYRGFSFKNILLVKSDFGLETQKKSFLDEKGDSHSYNVPLFAGGTEESVVRAFSTSDGKIIAVGNINYHKFTDYETATSDVKGSYIVTTEIMTQARSVLRMDEIGQLDLTYRRNADDPEKSLIGSEGDIKDACMLSDESIIIGGSIESFDGVPMNNLVKLDKQGQIDMVFQDNIGTGADGVINKITYYKDEEIEKILLVGTFNTFNGQTFEGLVMLNADGTIDQDFQFKKVQGGRPNFAKIVDLNTNGDAPMPHVVISGTFNKYDGVTRRGFLILDMKGDAIQRFNVPGEFRGELYDAHYSLTSDNTNGVLLVGNIYYFDGKRVNNIVMLKVEIDNVKTQNFE